MWTNSGIFLIGPLGTNFSEILIEIDIFSFKKMDLKMSSGKWHPFCLGLNVSVTSYSTLCLLMTIYPHDDVIKWKHFPRNWPFVREIHRSPVNFPHKGQWRGALMFSLIYAWINDWVNNREAGDLRRQHGHYDVIVMLALNARASAGTMINSFGCACVYAYVYTYMHMCIYIYTYIIRPTWQWDIYCIIVEYIYILSWWQ